METTLKPKTVSALPLFAGDVLVLGAVTLFGFESHQGVEAAGLYMLTTFLPLLAGWLLAAVPLGLYQPAGLREARQLWRPAYAMLLAAPVAAVLRALWLGRAVVPVFALVLAGVGAVAVLAWRVLYWALTSRMR